MLNPSKFTALQILTSIYGENHDSVAYVLQKIGMILFRAGNLQKALNYLEKAVDTFRRLGEDYSHQLATPLFIAGNIHHILQQTEEAHLMWEDTFETMINAGGGGNQEMMNTLSNLIDV